MKRTTTKKRKPLPDDRQDVLLGTVRFCSRCRDWWPATADYFWKDRRRDALARWCKACWTESKPDRGAKKKAGKAGA